MDGRDNTIKGCLVVEAYAPDAMAIKTSIGKAMQAQASIGNKQLKVNCGLICDVTEIISYTEIEYLTLNGVQVFDCGYKGNNKTEIYIKFKRTNITTNVYLLGSSGTSTTYLNAYMASNGNWRYGDYKKIYNTRQQKEIVAEITSGRITVDGVSGKFTPNEFTTPNTLAVGGRKTGNGVFDNLFRGYIYYYRMVIDGVLVCDWVPVRKDDGTECFFDRVKKEFIVPMETSQQAFAMSRYSDENDIIEDYAER